jgi:hypothetical protein
LSALVREFFAATKLLERRARGDWGPDQHLDQLAPSPNLSPAASLSPIDQRGEGVTGGRANRTQLLSAVALFEAYIKDKQVAASTIDGWRCVFAALDALPVQEAARDQRAAQRGANAAIHIG